MAAAQRRRLNPAEFILYMNPSAPKKQKNKMFRAAHAYQRLLVYTKHVHAHTSLTYAFVMKSDGGINEQERVDGPCHGNHRGAHRDAQGLCGGLPDCRVIREIK